MNWALTDHQGTVRDVVDSSGTVQNHITYDSFGQITSETNSSVVFRFGYTGREFDEETGQYYYRSRYYDASNGRFLSEDTIGFEGGDANLYRYVGNSPTNFTDPSGKIVFVAVPVAIGLLEAATVITAAVGLAWWASEYGDEVGETLRDLWHCTRPLRSISNHAGEFDSNYEIGQSNPRPAISANPAFPDFRDNIPDFGADVERGFGGGLAPETPSTVFPGFGEGLEQSSPWDFVFEARSSRMVPDPEALGEHIVIRRHGETGEITHYETFRPQTNPMNPTPWESVERFDRYGPPHFNRETGQYVPTPHIQGPNIPGGVRSADPNDIPN